MKNIKTYMVALAGLAISIGSFLLNRPSTSTAAATTDNTFVVNTTSNPVPVAVQGTTNVTGSVDVANLPGNIRVSNFPSLQPVTVNNFPNTQRVSVSNLPDTQAVNVSNFPDTQAVKPAGMPAVLEAFVPAFGHIQLPLLMKGATSPDLSGRLAIGSVTASARGGSNGSAIDVFLISTDCAGHELERLNLIEVNRGSTNHLDFPTPQMVLSDGARNQFCIEADVYPNSGDATTIYITLAGSLR
jgi:hypothetical protein